MNPQHSQEFGIMKQVESACRRIAPLWPLKNFVAVNPYMGLSDQPFWTAHETLNRLTGVGLCMPRAYYYEKIMQGRITRSDLQDALQELKSPWDLAAFEKILAHDPQPSVASISLFTDVLSGSDEDDWSGFVTERISRYCAAYFDQGQALWPMPWKDKSLYKGWLQFMRFDKSPTVMGLGNLDKIVLTLPDTAQDLIVWALQELQVPEEVLDDYLHAVLLSVGGWAGWTRYNAWQAELQGDQDDSTPDLLAIRLGWEVILCRVRGSKALKERWHKSLASYTRSLNQPNIRSQIDSVLQSAFEISYQKQLSAIIRSSNDREQAHARADIQAVFCIDVRSEVYRRALETVAPQVETRGFAGFFGIPMEYFPFGSAQGEKHSPVLFNPSHRIREGVHNATGKRVKTLLRHRHTRLRAEKIWKIFKTSASSCFAFVEAAGLLSAPKLITDSMGWTRPVTPPKTAGFQRAAVEHLGPVLTPEEESPFAELSGLTGLPEKERPGAAEFVLRHMGLTRDFSRLIVFVGHGSTTVNNPQATALDCGACGGHSGEASARLAAALLNDPSTRRSLSHKGIIIPEDTYFMAALHDTTTDEIKLFHEQDVPPSHKEMVAQLNQWMESAGHIARAERAALLDVPVLPGASIYSTIKRRAQNWAQLRPEWALAGNAAFIAAPRNRTLRCNFSGRAFLHDYNWQDDVEFSTLTLIMTAPLVVAQWINMQYYASIVDNRRFGSGNKVLHNVVGGSIGVLEGNGGDLRVGLALQSLHNGNGWMHEPLRLNVVIEAPTEAIDNVIALHRQVRELVDNSWIHLFQLDDYGRLNRRGPDKKWHLYQPSR